MTIDLNTLVQIGVLAGFAAGAFRCIVVRPLNSSIFALEKSITKLETRISILSTDMQQEREERIRMKDKLSVIEQNVTKAHDRIDNLEEIIGGKDGNP